LKGKVFKRLFPSLSASSFVADAEEATKANKNVFVKLFMVFDI